jgi:hypothetical protein
MALLIEFYQLAEERQARDGQEQLTKQEVKNELLEWCKGYLYVHFELSFVLDSFFLSFSFFLFFFYFSFISFFLLCLPSFHVTIYWFFLLFLYFLLCVLFHSLGHSTTFRISPRVGSRERRSVR